LEKHIFFLVTSPAKNTLTRHYLRAIKQKTIIFISIKQQRRRTLNPPLRIFNWLRQHIKPQMKTHLIF
ncbi:hypothetical protein, partial [Escherichia fergusonii]|uniref:hypothetical protein n=1 Tax=Escherichia fergusonii TaxID=564 RepID=UPI0020CC314C